MVGWLIHDQNVGCEDHHLGQHNTDTLTTGKDIHFLDAVLAREKHTAEETTYISWILLRREWHQPVYDRVITGKQLCIVLREVREACGHAPLVRPFIRFHFSGKDLEQGSSGDRIASHESNFIFAADDKGNIIQNLYSVNGLGKVFYGKNLITDLTFRTEINIRIFTAGRFHIVQLNFFQSTFSGGCLLRLGSVGTESLDKFLQLLDLFLFLLICFLHLLDHQLA